MALLFFPAFALWRFGGPARRRTMEADPDQQTPSPPRPTFRLLTRDDQKPVMEPPPAPDEEHPGDEPGYGHGV
jgi:hypothetical protein